MDKTFFEITRQYDMLTKTINYIRENRAAYKKFYDDVKPKKILFVGSGSSYFLSQSAELIASTHFDIEAMSIASGDAMVNFDTYDNVFKDSLVVATSRSGSTTEIINILKKMKEKFGVHSVGITCVENSELEEVTDICVTMPWTFDECVCQTGTVSNLYISTALLLASFKDSEDVFCEVEKAVKNGNEFIKKYDPEFKKIADVSWNKAVVLADGEVTGIATEGALAFKEICCTMSNFYHVLDVRHGPMVLIDKDTLVIIDIKPLNKKFQIDLVNDIAKKGATVVVVSDDSYETLDNVALHVKHENVGNIAEGLPLINAAQLISYHKAINKNVDPGNPVGLDAWINLA